MSLRYMSRVVYQSGMRAAQVMKEGVPKTLKDSAACGSSSSSRRQQQNQARKFSAGGALDSTSATIHKAAVTCDKFKQAEESLRTVLFLSCWGPN